MKTICFLIVFLLSFPLFCLSQEDSLNPYTDKQLLKLSNQIYELEKKDSLARASEPNGFDLKNESNISDTKLLVDLTNDSIHFYTGRDVIALSNYIYQLEKKDSVRKVKSMMLKVALAKEYRLKEEKKLENFEKIVLFNFDSFSLRKDSFKPLEDVSRILKTNVKLHFVIEGYTDIIGSAAYNKALSIRRATTVKKYFVSKGIPVSRIAAFTGFGATMFAASNLTAEGRSKNRRVVIKAAN